MSGPIYTLPRDMRPAIVYHSTVPSNWYDTFARQVRFETLVGAVYHTWPAGRFDSESANRLPWNGTNPIPARKEPDMARSTTIPETLDEYMAHVRSEALKVQVDMGWPDEKMNETLIALGLPPKLKFMVPVKLVGETMAFIAVEDKLTEEEARESVASRSTDELRTLAVNSGLALGSFAVVGAEVADVPNLDTCKVGDLDVTLANGEVYRAARAAGESRRQCENYHGSGSYCTRKLDHTGQHVAGNSRTVVAVWPNEN